MKSNIFKSLGLVFLTLFCVLTQAQAQTSSSEYLLSTDDVLSVTVFNEPDLNLVNAKISQNGTISVPLLGQVTVAGKTVSEAQSLLTELFLADYLKQPRVTVSISEYRPFYVDGQVQSPGSFPYRIDMTVQMAVAIAGGFTDRASKTSIYLLSEDSVNGPVKVGLNTEISPGDVVTVEESFF